MVPLLPLRVRRPGPPGMASPRGPPQLPSHVRAPPDGPWPPEKPDFSTKIGFWGVGSSANYEGASNTRLRICQFSKLTKFRASAETPVKLGV